MFDQPHLPAQLPPGTNFAFQDKCTWDQFTGDWCGNGLMGCVSATAGRTYWIAAVFARLVESVLQQPGSSFNDAATATIEGRVTIQGLGSEMTRAISEAMAQLRSSRPTRQLTFALLARYWARTAELEAWTAMN